MVKYFAIFLLILSILIGCNKIDSFGKFSIYQKIDDSNKYILIIKDDSRSYSFNSDLKIDIRSLNDLGEFLIDNKRIYYKYDISDETIILELKNCDKKTFQTYDNSIYARDKNYVYDSRNGRVENADVNTFKAIKIELNGRIAYGKDKNHYYFWNKIVADTFGFTALIQKN